MQLHASYEARGGSDVFRAFGRPVYWFGCPNCVAQKALFRFSFFSYISTKNMLQ